MNVVVADVNDASTAEVVKEAQAEGVGAIGVHTDVSSLEANEALLAATIEAFGQANVVCLNAGVTGSAGRSWTLSQQDWEWSLGILLDGVIHGVRTFVPGLVEHDDGHVVITASIAGHVASAFSAPYMVAKHGVAVLAETLYHELRSERSSVGVTCLCPGFVNTNIVQAAKELEGQTGSPQDEKGQRWLDFSERALSTGLDPAIVGEQVHDAIVDDQFWLFTDQMWDAPIAKRAHEITHRLPPTVGQPSMD